MLKHSPLLEAGWRKFLAIVGARGGGPHRGIDDLLAINLADNVYPTWSHLVHNRCRNSKKRCRSMNPSGLTISSEPSGTRGREGFARGSAV